MYVQSIQHTLRQSSNYMCYAAAPLFCENPMRVHIYVESRVKRWYKRGGGRQKYGAKPWGGYKNSLRTQWTSSGRSSKENAEALAWKKVFQALSLCLSFLQSVRDGARWAYVGQVKRICCLVCSVSGPQNLQCVGASG